MASRLQLFRSESLSNVCMESVVNKHLQDLIDCFDLQNDLDGLVLCSLVTLVVPLRHRLARIHWEKENGEWIARG